VKSSGEDRGAEHNSHVFPSRPPLRTVLVRSLSESSCKRAGNASSESELAGELASSLNVRSGDYRWLTHHPPTEAKMQTETTILTDDLLDRLAKRCAGYDQDNRFFRKTLKTCA
jgi:hypothetical protein